MSIIELAHHSARELPRPEACVENGDARSSRRVPRQQLVAHVMAYIRDNIGEPVTVAELSRIAGVSERTLRAAFHDVIGLSPKQYAISGRLRAAHAALSAANPETTTVTDIAMAFGFYELGRFAERYRHAFGEVPSRTLRHERATLRHENAPEQAA
jgi:transcriptional regulator GlxA family with amidase domain